MPARIETDQETIEGRFLKDRISVSLAQRPVGPRSDFVRRVRVDTQSGKAGSSPHSADPAAFATATAARPATLVGPATLAESTLR